MNSILIVEDHLRTRHALSRTFSARGFLCDVAANEEEGFEALDYARKQDERYGLAVFAVSLFAGPFGEQVLKDSHLNRTGFEGYTRIVLTQRNATSNAILNGFRLGCDGFLELPLQQFALEKLISYLKE